MPEFQLALLAIFILVFSYWFVHLICYELEQPFSARCTAIDLAQVQDELNARLQAFVSGAQRAPLELRAEAVRPSMEETWDGMEEVRSLRSLHTLCSSASMTPKSPKSVSTGSARQSMISEDAEVQKAGSNTRESRRDSRDTRITSRDDKDHKQLHISTQVHPKEGPDDRSRCSLNGVACGGHE